MTSTFAAAAAAGFLLIQGTALPPRTQLTADAGDEIWASWSPDGSSIVFAQSGQATGDIRVIDAVTSIFDSRRPLARTVASSPGQDRHPRWTPDGRIVFDSDRNGHDDVFIVGADGSGVRQLTGGPKLDGAGAVGRGSGILAFVSSRNGRMELFVLEPGGTERQVATSPRGIVGHSWFPDGVRLAYMTDGPGNWDIHELNVRTGASKVLVASAESDSAPRPSPDGTSLLFTRGTGPTRNLWIIDLRTGRERQLTRLQGGTEWSTWCPSGTQVVFSLGGDAEEDLYAVRAADGEVTRLTDTPGREIAPSCSPDGRVVFSAGPNGSLDLFLLQLPGR